MTPTMEQRQGQESGSVRQLSLAYSGSHAVVPKADCLPADTTAPSSGRVVAQVTMALMCRLWIPHGSTIVGLLGVGVTVIGSIGLGVSVGGGAGCVASEERKGVGDGVMKGTVESPGTGWVWQAAGRTSKVSKKGRQNAIRRDLLPGFNRRLPHLT